MSLLIVNYFPSKTLIIWISSLYYESTWCRDEGYYGNLSYALNLMFTFLSLVFSVYMDCQFIMFYTIPSFWYLTFVFYLSVESIIYRMMNIYMQCMLRTSILNQSFHVVITYPSYSRFSTSIFHYCIITGIRWLMTHSVLICRLLIGSNIITMHQNALIEEMFEDLRKRVITSLMFTKWTAYQERR